MKTANCNQIGNVKIEQTMNTTSVNALLFTGRQAFKV